jgi:hypothetical protein
VDRFDDGSNTTPGSSTPGNVTLHSHGLPFRDPGGLAITDEQKRVMEKIEKAVQAKGQKDFKFEYTPGPVPGTWFVTVPDSARNQDTFYAIAQGLTDFAHVSVPERSRLMHHLYGGGIEQPSPLYSPFIDPLPERPPEPKYQDTIRPLPGGPKNNVPLTDLPQVVGGAVVGPVFRTGGVLVDAGRITVDPNAQPKYSVYADVPSGKKSLQEADNQVVRDGIHTAALVGPPLLRAAGRGGAAAGAAGAEARGAATAAEARSVAGATSQADRAAAGAAPGGAAPTRPAVPDFAGGKTSGVLRTPTGDVPLQSGWQGPALSIPKGTSGFDIVTRTHVEGHAAAAMRQQGLTDATVYINNPVICDSCMNNLPRMLPNGSRLTVVTPDGTAITFTGGSRNVSAVLPGGTTVSWTVRAP